jgi:hypothetical protein
VSLPADEIIVLTGEICRTLIVDVHAVRYADNSRWDGLTDEVERKIEDRTKKEMLAARMREVSVGLLSVQRCWNTV